MSRLTDYSKFDHLTEDSDDEHDHVTHDTATTTKTASLASAPLPVAVAAPKQQQRDTTTAVGGIIRRDESSGRYLFEYNGNTVYEFEQSLDDVTIYIRPPPYVTRGNQINCVIAANHFKLGLVGHGGGGNNNNDKNDQTTCQWFLNEGTFGTVDVDESTWTLEDDDGVGTYNINHSSDRRKIIVVTLTKANRGTVWEAALRGNPNAAGDAATNNNNETAAAAMDPVSKEQVKKDLMLQRFQEENPGFDFSGADFNGSVPDARVFMGGVKYQ